MEMKIKKLFGAFLALTVTAGWVSCSDDPAVDPYTINYLYFENNRLTYSITYAASSSEDGYGIINGFEDHVVLPPIRSTKPAATDIRVKLVVDPAAAMAYNSKIESETQEGREPQLYSMLENSQIETTELIIPKGEYQSTDSVRIRYKMTDFYGENTRYMLPVMLVSSASGTQVPDDGHLMLTYNATLQSNKVRMSNTEVKYQLEFDKATQTPTNATTRVELGNLLRSTLPAAEDITVHLNINPDLIDGNWTYGSYKKVTNATMDKDTYTIHTDKQTIDEPIVVKFADNMASINEIGQKYCIPVEITAVDGRGAAIDDYYTVVYLVVETSYVIFVKAATGPVGTPIPNSSWQVWYTYNNGSSWTSTSASTFQGNGGYNRTFSSYNNYIYKIDLGGTYDLTGFMFGAVKSWSTWYNTCRTMNVKVALSDGDISSYEDLGNSQDLVDAADGRQYVEFASPKRARWVLLQSIAEYWYMECSLDANVGMIFYQ